MFSPNLHGDVCRGDLLCPFVGLSRYRIDPFIGPRTSIVPSNFISMEYVQTVVTLLCTCRLFLHINQLSGRLVTVKRLKAWWRRRNSAEKRIKQPKIVRQRDKKPSVTSVPDNHRLCICRYVHSASLLNLGIRDSLVWNGSSRCVWRLANNRGISFIVSTEVGIGQQSRHWVGTWGTADRRRCRWRRT
jgi:hypothetical protein